MGVGGIFLHGWIHNQTAVPQGDNRFCSITTFHGEKSDFLLKMWCFGALPAHTKSTHKSKFLTAQNFPAHAALVQGLSLHKKGTHQVSGKSDTGFWKYRGRGTSMPPTIVFALFIYTWLRILKTFSIFRAVNLEKCPIFKKVS